MTPTQCPTQAYAQQGLEGAVGLQGKSWPDHDMLPLGYQKPARDSPWPRANGLTEDEQRTLMTLWAVTRSPLIYGGRLDNMTRKTVALLTQPRLLELNQRASKPPKFLVRRPHAQRAAAIGAGTGYGYQGLGYAMAACNSSDPRQQWNASLLQPSTATG